MAAIETDGALVLRPLPIREARALLAGRRPRPGRVRLHPDYPLADSVAALAMLLDAHTIMSGAAVARRPVWWTWQIAVGALVVGDIGFHGPPPEEPPFTVEIGYGVVPAWRGRGVATRACALILAAAWRAGADLVTAETDPGNAASRQVLLRNGLRPDPAGVFVVTRPSP